MSERLGIRAAARAAGLGTNHVALYVAVARGSLKAAVVDGQLEFDPGDLDLWRQRLDAERDAREQASIESRDAKFKAVNSRNPSTGNRG